MGTHVAVGTLEHQALVAGQRVGGVVLHEAAHAREQDLALQVEFRVLREPDRAVRDLSNLLWLIPTISSLPTRGDPDTAQPSPEVWVEEVREAEAMTGPRVLPGLSLATEQPSLPSQRYGSSSLCCKSRPRRPGPVAGSGLSSGGAKPRTRVGAIQNRVPHEGPPLGPQRTGTGDWSTLQSSDR